VGKLSYDIALALQEWMTMGGEFKNFEFTLGDDTMVSHSFSPNNVTP
jgi:hypothetical protein